MKEVSAKPIAQPHNNCTLKGYGDVADLPTTKVVYADHQAAVVSVWAVSFWSRLRWLFDGRINLIVYGNTHAPVAVTIGQTLPELVK